MKSDKPFASIKELKELNKDFYAFSIKLMRNRNTVSFSSLDFRVTSRLKPLNSKTLLELWDSLLYQTITKDKNPILREALIRLLIADSYYKYVQEVLNTYNLIYDIKGIVS